MLFFHLILITKNECDVVRARYPNLYIPRTCKQKSKRHHYYLTEAIPYLKLISDTNYLAAEILAEKESRVLRQKFSLKGVDLD